MAYLGKTPSQATRRRYYKTASGSETSLSGTMTTGGTLTFTDGEFVDVSVNGVALVAGTDYNTTTANTIGGLSALSADDQVEIVVYDTFSVFGGNVNGDFTISNGTLTASGNVSFDGGTIKLDGNYPTGSNNVALGDTALDDGSLSGAANVAIGHAALTANTSGNSNTGVGFAALDANTTGGLNTAVGQDALGANTTASNNTALGYQALRVNTTGAYNVGVGADALYSNTTGEDNVAVGRGLYTNTTGDKNTAVGRSALYSNTTADNNTAVGHSALFANTTGTENVAVGKGALDAATTGNYNTGIGTGTLSDHTTGEGNTAVGRNALGSNTTASNNTAVGKGALVLNTTGSSNTALGYNTGASNQTGSENTFIGHLAGNANTGDDNVFVGQGAGYYSTGSNNTFLGKDAGVSMTSGAKNTIIGKYTGNNGGLDIRTSNNHIVLSDGDGNPRQIINGSGDVFINTTSQLSDGKVSLATTLTSRAGITIKNLSTQGSGHTYIRFTNSSNAIAGSIQHTGTTTTSYGTSSDYRLKENVVDMTGATTRLKQLNPVRFNFIADADTTVDGFLAHEVQTVVPEAVMGEHNEVDNNNNPIMQQIDHSKLVPLLVATIQELEARIATLEAK